MHALDKRGAVIYGTKYRILIIKMTKKSVFFLNNSSLSLSMREIKTTLRFHIFSVNVANIKKSTDNKCWHGCRIKESYELLMEV